jgi:hypothetical protein
VAASESVKAQVTVVVLPLSSIRLRSDTTTLNPVGETDWLERGHGGGEGLRPMIKSSIGRAADRVSIRSVLRGGDVRSPRKPRRRTKALVGWLLYCCTAVGGTAAAFTVRATLFPQLGGPTKALWVSPTPEVPLTTEHGASSSEGKDTTPVFVKAAVVAAAATAGPGSSADAQTVPSASSPDADRGNAADNHGPSANAGPSRGTTVAHDPNGGPGTIVDEHPTDPAGPGSSTSVDPTAPTVSTPDSPAPSTTTPDPESGKDKGGGGGGGGGGGHSTDPPTP